jgi:glyoxylase-like metal-dependent hydrolase (beta-lactamase superfamily II)
MVINTHGHHDHTGCNRLFGSAEVVLHKSEGAARMAGGEVRRVEGDTDLFPGLRVIATPGHSRGSISVVAEADEGAWVMAGDALPTYDNFLAWVPPGIHFDPDVALMSMQRIVDLAWMIVPGHGAPFPKEGELPPGILQVFY